jgi:hypothetical protein
MAVCEMEHSIEQVRVGGEWRIADRALMDSRIRWFDF